MKRLFTISVVLTMALGLMAQETTVSVLVREDGKVVKDTTYVYDSAEDAEHAVRILNLVSERGGEDSNFHYVMKTGTSEKHAHSAVFISEDGETTHIHGDSVVWKGSGDHDCKHVKVMKVHVDEEGEHSGEHVKVMKVHVDEEGEHSGHGERVIIVKTGDGESFDILLDEDCDHEMDGTKVIKKEVKVIVEGDEDGEWNVIEKELDNDTDEEVEVIVVKKKEQKKSKKQ